MKLTFPFDSALSGIGGQSAMSPSFPQFNVVNGFSSNAVVPANRGAGSAISTYHVDLRFGQFGLRGLFTSRGDSQHVAPPFPRRIFTASRDFVGLVLKMGAPAQMLWVAARRIVAAVQGYLALRPWLPDDEKRNVRGDAFSFVYVEKTIAPARLCRFPFPALAIRTLFELRPKASLYNIVNPCNVNFSHGADPLRGGQGRALLKQRFRPVFLSRIQPFAQAVGGLS